MFLSAWRKTHLYSVKLKQEHERRGSSRIRFDSAPETMAGKQALHKSIHSRLQLFPKNSLIQHSYSMNAFVIFYFLQ